MELVTVQAAMTGDYSLALQAFTLNPLISNGLQAEALLQDMLLAHEDYLPQFAPAIQHIKERRNNQ
ncbi:TPA: hypothetical protein TXN53_000045 [Streptococcus suis]|nr:hypothetical protein D2E16_11120 [Streptococcus suis]HEL1655797.1 hypothetical protein [Streptococcus suis]HEL1660559.1 hypothetical protein [Streptococcus suis]HEL1961364.1 hypothetical protein [Streptococcus suis]HEP1800719.1 hypothetical protein [Streptococcus suis]